MNLILPKQSAKFLLPVLILVTFLTILFYTTISKEDIINNVIKIKSVNQDEYLLKTSHCTIPKLDPNRNVLHIDSDVLLSKGNDTECCYKDIGRKDEFHITLSECKPFENNVTLTSSNTILVYCSKNGTQVYENAHAFVSSEYLNKSKPKTDKEPLSVLMLGMDSVSKLNFVRSMPKTKTWLEQNKFVPLNVYNKIGDNTFPNLMAVFTGLNATQALKACEPTTVGRLDQCPLLWYRFQKHNYVTAYAEDTTFLNTFTYQQKGFTQPPTDFYFRPYFMATERLSKVYKANLAYCIGPESAGERIINLAKDFENSLRRYLTFGFFWTNSFSHNDLSVTSSMDERFLDYFQQLDGSGTLNRSIVVFFSDHGIRFGNIRQTFTGWLEERMPLFYVSFPPWFVEKYPNEYRSFWINSNRLTTPYDIYMTLQHILTLADASYTIQPSEGCPKSQSLFKEVDLERSCDDACIDPHWCACHDYLRTSKNDSNVINSVQFVVDRIQQIINSSVDAEKCDKYLLSKIISSYRTKESPTFLLLVFETNPKGVFESTLLVDGDNQFEIVGGISRLDSYAGVSKCISNKTLELYCHCKKK